MSAEIETLHGVFVEVLGVGVLLGGSAGIGKSALALELVSRGHKLIADDAPEFRCSDCGTVNGSCPAILQDFLEVYGLGVLNIPAMFGVSAIKKSSQLQLLISLLPADQFQLDEDKRLHGNLHQQTVLGIDIPVIELPVLPERNIAIMVESVIRNHLLSMGGYSAAEQFINRQSQWKI